MHHPSYRHEQLAGAAAYRFEALSDFGLRPSFGFRFSVFGFQGDRRLALVTQPHFQAVLAS
jgi:hypothetical protein